MNCPRQQQHSNVGVLSPGLPAMCLPLACLQIMSVDVTSGATATVAGDPATTGSADPANQPEPWASALFTLPTGLAYDAANNYLYVAEG